MAGITEILKTMFAWPQGIVVGNLIASAITGSLVVLHNHLQHKKLREHIHAIQERKTEKISMGSQAENSQEIREAP